MTVAMTSRCWRGLVLGACWRRGLAALPSLVTGALMLLWAVGARAQAVPDGSIMQDAIKAYSDVTSKWLDAILPEAKWLFVTLATISLVWTFGMMALRRADIGEFFAELIRFIMFFGFYWWLLVNAGGKTGFAALIVNSMEQLGAKAGGLDPASMTSGAAPDSIMHVGFNVLGAAIKNLKPDLFSIPKDLGELAISVVVLVIIAVIAVNMLMLVVSSYVLINAGVIFLGFGGGKWTSDMAISYYKTVLNVAAQLFTMVLLVGVGQSFIVDYYHRVSSALDLTTFMVLLVVVVILWQLVERVPPMVGGLAGAGIDTVGRGMSVGGAVGAAAGFAAGAVVQTAGAAMAVMSAAKGLGGGGGGEISKGGDGEGRGSGGGLSTAMGDKAGGDTSAGGDSASGRGSSSAGGGKPNRAAQFAGALMQGAGAAMADHVKKNSVGGRIADAIDRGRAGGGGSEGGGGGGRSAGGKSSGAGGASKPPARFASALMQGTGAAMADHIKKNSVGGRIAAAIDSNRAAGKAGAATGSGGADESRADDTAPDGADRRLAEKEAANKKKEDEEKEEQRLERKDEENEMEDARVKAGVASGGGSETGGSPSADWQAEVAQFVNPPKFSDN